MPSTNDGNDQNLARGKALFGSAEFFADVDGGAGRLLRGSEQQASVE
jgi:hypothetical protein